MIRRFLNTKRIIKPIINITNNAWLKMNNILSKTNNIGFIFSADSGGCNGFNYNLELINKSEFDKLKNPTVIENNIKNNNIKLIIEPFSEFYLIGTTIDFIKEDYTKGIFESKFNFIPDKKTAYSCGCGKSFTLRE